MLKTIIFSIILISTSFAQTINFLDKPELFAPDTISTKNSEVKITFTNDGRIALWAAIGYDDGIGGSDIFMSVKEIKYEKEIWSKPQPVSFNSSADEFSPYISPDNKRVYFLSNRSGGFGGDDIYYASFDTVRKVFGNPVNLGNEFNTSGNECCPSISPNGQKLLYCSNGFGGRGMHDIFLCKAQSNTWTAPASLDILNSEKDELDPQFLHDNKTIIFSRADNEYEANLYVSYEQNGSYSFPSKIDEQMNIPGKYNFGASIDPSDSSHIYYSTKNLQNSKGKSDIYRIKYKVVGFGQ